MIVVAIIGLVLSIIRATRPIGITFAGLAAGMFGVLAAWYLG